MSMNATQPTSIDDMTTERAREIVAICMSHVWKHHDITDAEPKPLGDLTLMALLRANHIVLNLPGGGMVCDDRLVAALYVAHHYPAQSEHQKRFEPIITVGDDNLLLIRREE